LFKSFNQRLIHLKKSLTKSTAYLNNSSRFG